MIVMPAYNEARNIGLMIHELFDSVFPQINGVAMHLLVVDDLSPDGTGDIVKKLQAKYKNLHLLQKQKEGLGWAYVRGFQYAMKELHADAVMEMDADFQHPPRFVIPMVEAFLDGADYVIGSRYVKGGSVPKNWALFRKAVSFFGNLYIRIVFLNFKYHDMTTGFRLTRVKGVMDQIDLEHLKELKRFAHKVHLFYLTSKLAKKVVEVPLEFAERTKDVSKFNPKETFASLKLATILGIMDKQRFIKFAIVGGTGFVVNFVGLELLKRAGLSTYFATLIATELAIVSNFIFNNIWTFSDKAIKSIKDIIPQFIKFNVSSLFAVIVQPLIVAGATKFFGETSTIRFAALVFALIFVIVPYNYIVYNLFIWKTWKLPRKKS